MIVVDIPPDPVMRAEVAGWLVTEWRHLFPDDDVEWYFDVWTRADETGVKPPHCVVAIVDGAVVGTASMVLDDELPGADEPGPWIAAVYVLPEHRGAGVGTALMSELMSRRSGPLWLYTENEADWYRTMGWREVRAAELNGCAVTVMTLGAPDGVV